MSKSPIRGFSQDDEGDWFAELACGHIQHVRHRPPLQSRPWVETEEGRDGHLGVELDCPYCEMPRLPQDVVEYRRTDTFDAQSVPKGLLKSHRTKRGVWGQIVVTRGHLVYVIESDPPRSFPLNARVAGIVEPELPHHVILQEGSEFHVRFLRGPEADQPEPPA